MSNDENKLGPESGQLPHKTAQSTTVGNMGGVQDDPPKLIQPRRWTVLAMAGAALVGVLGILYAWQLWPFTSSLVITENAYVRGQITVLAPQVSGYVTEVLVQDFVDVEQGQILLRIDDRVYRQRVEQARAELMARKFDLDNNVQTQASNRATLVSRRAERGSVEAELHRVQADERRVNELAAEGAVSIRERDQIRATARTAVANMGGSRAAIEIAEQNIKASKVARGGLLAQVRMAEANLSLAEIDLANTVIRAPRNAQLSEVSVRLGQYVTAGSQLLYLVPEQLWVTANYKETQVSAMRIGQQVSFSVDALEGTVFNGWVERFAPATGSEFSVLRPDNATGNFTKVVQRIPVRIAVDAEQPMTERLTPGMSVVVRVDTSSTGNEQGRRP